MSQMSSEHVWYPRPGAWSVGLQGPVLHARCRHYKSPSWEHVAETKLRDWAGSKPDHHGQMQKPWPDLEYWTVSRFKGPVPVGCSILGGRQGLAPEFMCLLITGSDIGSQPIESYLFFYQYFLNIYLESLHIRDMVVLPSTAKKKKKKDLWFICTQLRHSEYCSLWSAICPHNMYHLSKYTVRAEVTNVLQLCRHDH